MGGGGGERLGVWSGWVSGGWGVLEKDFHEIFVTCFGVTDLRKEKLMLCTGCCPPPFFLYAQRRQVEII
jgi:hypothetical protein